MTTMITGAGGDGVLAALPAVPDGLLSGLGAAAALLLLLGLPILALELVRLWRTDRLDRRRVAGMLTSLFCFVPATVVEALLAGVLLGLFAAASSLAPWTIPSSWATALLCLLLVDLLYYWEHRLGHQVNALWSLYHSIHHSADHFDQTVGFRISFVDFFVTPLVYLPLVLVGFHPLLVLACFGLVLAWQQWIHTELVGRLPLLDPWLNTPSNHRVHHGRNPGYLDRNYGGILMIWDRLFGSHEPEGEPVDYGLVDPLHSRHPLAVHFHALGRLIRELAAAGSLRQVALLLLGKPGASA